MFFQKGTCHLHCPVDLFLFFLAFSLLHDLQYQCNLVGREADSLLVGPGDEGKHDRGKIFARLTVRPGGRHLDQFQFRRV